MPIMLLLVGAGACHREVRSTETAAAPEALPESEVGMEQEPQPDEEPQAEGLRVHLSFDDAPWMEERGRRVPAAAEVTSINRAIIRTLREHRAPASVFFNCDRLQDGERTIESWADAGFTVGNHTSSHANLASTPIEAWMDDVERCHRVLSERLPQPPRYFRYPYLSQGDTRLLRDDARGRLTALGYRNAHVTVATTEWLLAFTYRQAKRRGDAALEVEVVRDYRRHMLDAVEQGRVLARAEVGRETAQIVLFHVNELAADHLGEVLEDYRAQGWTLVGLGDALADPVFDRVDHYVGRGGLSWLARIHEDPKTRPPYWFADEEMRLMGRYGDSWQPPE